MKKNGFTLVELIATMVLLAVLATIILVNMTGIKSNEDDNRAKTFQKNVEEAACALVDSIDAKSIIGKTRDECKSSSCTIYLSKLISDSVALIDPDEVDPYNNKKASEEQNSVYVQVKWVNKNGYKEKVCEMKRN